MSNVFLKNLDQSQVNQLIECMQHTELSSGESIINEGEIGNELYILEKGQVSHREHMQL